MSGLYLLIFFLGEILSTIKFDYILFPFNLLVIETHSVHKSTKKRNNIDRKKMW